MKAINKLVSVFMVLLFTSIFAVAWAAMPAKYDLDKQLEKVDSIYKYKFMGWEKVDNQYFVVQTSPSDYYLVVLSSPSDKILFSENIRIDSTNDMVRPGFNNVYVRSSGMTDEYIINKIYKFKDYKQVQEIEAQLTGEKK